MLKIKDNVDLKELRQMEFKYDDNDGKYKYIERNVDGDTYIFINKWNRKVVFKQGKVSDTLCLLKLYDLITARISRESRGVEYERRRDN